MSDGFVPPAEVQANAKRGLELRAKYNRGGTEVGVARARDLSNGKALSLDTIKRMVSYFARHEVDKKGEGWGKDSAGYIAWLLWGGDAGRSWANRISTQNEKKDKTTMADFANAYAAIIKADKNDDGTMTVYGKATDDSIDSDNQICDAAWLNKAMPEWFKTGGNIREQHSNIAAGVAQELESKSDGHYIQALVVDPVSVKKVESGVLKGFSIGIRAPRVVRDQKAANGRIIDGQIVEVSLVDRPANPNAKLMLAKSVEGEPTLVRTEELHEFKAPLPTEIFKREFSAQERQDAAEAGEAMPDGSYPIKTTEDLKNAIQAFGRAKNPAKVKQHIITRARALGATDLLPDDWKKTMKSLELLDIVKDSASDTGAARKALADLLIEELTEYADGEDETWSISALTNAINALTSFEASEAAEGEPVANIEMADSPDSTAGCDCDGCKECKDAGGCDSKMCKSHMEEKSATHKCLECGCGLPEDDHDEETVETAGGDVNNPTANVSTAEIVTPEENAGSEKSAEASQENSEAQTSDDKSLEDIVEQAVKSAMASVKAEIDSLKAAKEAATEKSVKLEAELATALNKAAAGGPKRTAIVAGSQSNEYLAKAAEYTLKAKATTDPVLRDGYKALAAEFAAKGNPSE